MSVGTVAALARAALARDHLELRAIALELWRSPEHLASLRPPATADGDARVVAAALIELLCERAGVSAPEWARAEGRLSEPFYLPRRAAAGGFTKRLCDEETPGALRRHGLLAPPDFLVFV